MKNRWVNLLFFLLVILISALSYHLFFNVRTREAAQLLINILKPLSTLLFAIVLFVISRHLVKLYLARKRRTAGFRLQTKLILALLPLTLLPSLALFFLATRSLDNFLLDVTDNSLNADLEARVIEDHFTSIEPLILKHGPAVMALFRKGGPEMLVYLEKYGLDGVECYRADVLEARFLTPQVEQEKVRRIEETASFVLTKEDRLGTRFADILLARYAYSEAPETLHFIATTLDPAVEARFTDIRERAGDLNLHQRRANQLKDINRTILFFTTGAIIFGGIWTGLTFSRRFLQAFSVVIEGARQVAEGNFDTRLQLETGDEMEDVLNAFNSMTANLKSKQSLLAQKAEDLEHLNTRLSGQIRYTQTILERTSAGILSTDFEGRIQTYNPAVLRILELETIDKGKLLIEALPGKKYLPLLQQWEDFFKKECAPTFRQLELVAEKSAETKYVAATIVPLEEGVTRFGHLLVLEDLTQLLNAQKQAAWQEVAKRVAHEIKNPLTPIQLSMQRIHRKACNDAPDLKEAVNSAYETVISETDLLKNLVNEFSTFAKLPSPVKSEVDLGELIGSVVHSYKPVFRHLSIRAQTDAGDHRVYCDQSQMRQVLTNLIQNAAQATAKGGHVTVGLEGAEDLLTLSVSDDGVGIPEAEKEKVFIPYYSKSPKGTGLGLAIVKRIVEDHGGDIRVQDNQPNGTRFVVHLPR